MKILSILLSVYVMLLTGISCADAFESASNPHELQIKSASDVHTECPGDTCSPLCACSCCAGFTQPVTFKIQTVGPVNTAHNSGYQQRIYYAVIPSLFQPPRI